MPYKKLHDDEVTISLELVKTLVSSQFPQWEHLPLRYLEPAGTDNVMFRLGDDYVIRLPRIASAAKNIQKELQWLPVLAPHLKVKIPKPVATGIPAEDYPFQWAIYEWITGETVSIGDLTEPHQLARDLAAFLSTLQRIDTTGAPLSSRSESLAERNSLTRKNIGILRDQIDADTAYKVWEAGLSATQRQQPLLWIHADLQAGNLLTRDGQLVAIIDFGIMGLGDPACDLQVAWNLLPDDARHIFRDALQVNEAMWSRGRAWALSVGVIALPYYQESNPILANISRRAINAAIADFRASS